MFYVNRTGWSSDNEESDIYWVDIHAVLPDPNGLIENQRSGQRFSSVQCAMNYALDGDTIVVQPDTYTETLYFEDKNLVLTSIDPMDPNIVANTILNGGQCGSTVTFGGAESSSCILTGFTITGGQTDQRGGGILGNSTQATISHCIIRNNLASTDGSGADGCGGVISNCLIYDNSAAGYGGGLNDCNGTIISCTVTENEATIDGGGLSNSSGTITNCIVWGNTSDNLFGCSMPTYSCWPEAAATGNIAVDPLFIDPNGLDGILGTTDDDFRLMSYSGCINAGDPTGDYSGQTDLDGNIRLRYGQVDMGAYETYPIAGDFEPDEDVDLADFSSLAQMWMNACDETNDWCGQCDIDQSGTVQLDDLAYFMSHWMYTN
jgi:hypothetical protein